MAQRLVPTETLVSAIKTMNSRQISAVITIVIMSVSFIIWVENRYAKLQDTTNNIKTLSTQIIQLQSQILSVVNSLPAHQRKEVVDRAAVSNTLTIVPEKAPKH